MATPVIMPKFEMSQEAATVIEWLKQEGEAVEKGEPLLTVETDKVTMDVESPASGILGGVRVVAQEVVPVTEVIAYILQPGEALEEEASEQVASGQVSKPALSAVEGSASSPVPSAPLLPRPPAPAEKVRATPVARRIAREHGVDLAAVDGSGPRGRVQAADVLARVQPAAESAVAAAVSAGQVIPLVGMRRTIAERMTGSYQAAPHIALTVRVDMGAFEETRAQLNTRAEAEGSPRVSITALLIKAVAWALVRNPWLNSTLRDEAVHLLPEIDIGVAVALDEGLIVPVVRGADRKGVGEIAAEVKALTARAREGRLTPADVSGGTFTISNLGPLGVEQFTAIINPPQAAILAVGAAQPEVVPGEGGEVAVRPIMRMTLSADHRIVDGAVAARFLADLREALEKPALLLW